MTFNIILLGLFVILNHVFICEEAFAGLNQWSSIGPWGGDRYEVVIDPVDNQKLYVLGGAIHRSVDGGENWEPLMNISESTRGLTAFNMAINPQETNEMYVGTLFEGVWKSSNGGELWESTNNGLSIENQQIRSVLIDMNDLQTLYIGLVNNNEKVTAPIYRSTNKGSSWQAFAAGLPETYSEITAVFQNPINGQLFAATYGGGVYKLKQDYSGQVWTAVNQGLSSPLGLYITHIEFDPNDQQVMYVCTQKDWVYKSTDEGETWTHLQYPESLNADYPPMAYYLRVDPNNSQVIWIGALPGSHYPNESPFYKADTDQDIGGLFQSIDGGTTWKKVLNEFGGFRLTIDATETVNESVTKSKVLYLTSGGLDGVLKSDTGGSFSERKIKGINGVWINGLLQHPYDAAKLFAFAESGNFFSSDNGDTWSSIKPISNERVIYTWSMATDPLNSSLLYITTGEPSWDWPENKGLYTLDISQINNDGELSDTPEQINSTSGIGIWKVYPLIDSHFDPLSTVIYLATQDSGVMKSFDNGSSWVKLNDGLGGMNVTCLAFEAENKLLFAGTRTSKGDPFWVPDPTIESGAIYKWGGESSPSWSRVGEDIISSGVFDIVIHPEDSNTIYVAALAGFYVSTDGGNTWDQKSLGLPEFPYASGIEIDPLNSNRIFLSSWLNGVFVSVDGGNYWTTYTNNLKPFFVQDILIDWQDPSKLYAATLGGSIAKCTIGSAPVVDAIIANGIELTTPYNFTIEEMEQVEIKIEASDLDFSDDLTFQAYYNGAKVPAPEEVANPQRTFTFDPDTQTFQWLPIYGDAAEEPFIINFLISDGAFSTTAIVAIKVNPAPTIFAPTIDISLPKEVYYQNDWLDLYASVSNDYLDCTVDIYLLAAPENDPNFLTFSLLKGGTLFYGFNLQNIQIVHYQLTNLPTGTYVWTGVIVSSGADVTDIDNWISSDSASFTYNNYELE